MNSTSLECLAVVPARGGSKGLPRKNVKLLQGTPLVARTIECAQNAATVTRVVVSTDDPEIGDIAKRYGADVVWRPAELSGDGASSESALLHALDELGRREGYSPEVLVMLQCTSPLTQPRDIDQAVHCMLAHQADSSFTAGAFHHFLWQTEPSGLAVGINHSGSKRKRRQELPKQLLENGAVYVMRVEPFRQTLDRFCGRVVACEVPPDRQLEIDDARDFSVAQALLASQDQQEIRARLPHPVKAIVFDFDGVMTDNLVSTDERGEEMVRCSRADGHGIALLRELQIPMLILSRERNAVVEQRARKLRIQCAHGVDDKLALLRGWLDERKIQAEQAVFVGNDTPDVACMMHVGCSVCPADAHPTARAVARIVLKACGGKGAVRELCDLIIEADAVAGSLGNGSPTP